MTSRERWLAALRFEPVDRLPFWPKLDGAYARGQPAPYNTMDIAALQRWIGSDNHVWVPGPVRQVRSKTKVEVITSDSTRNTVFVAPCGRAEMVERFDSTSQSWHPISHPVRTRSDIQVLLACFEDCRVELDEDQLAEATRQVKQVGSMAPTACGVGTTALMQWVQHLAGIENGHYLLADCEADVLELFEAIHRVVLQTVRLTCEHAPSDVLYLVENTSTKLISPDQYRMHCYPHVLAYARVAKDAGRLFVIHMCGHLKAILPDLATLPVTAFEAFTSPPVGNTTFREGRSACPETCLIGGTNAVLWTQPAETIIAQIEAELNALPHHRGVVVSSAGVMPPLAAPETIKSVCDWLKTYPVIA